MKDLSFAEKVRNIVSDIPEGETISYKEVAVRAGHPRAYRAVGAILRRNYDPTVPCHRVICSDGKPGGYNRGGSSRKEELLTRERIGKRSNEIA